MKITKITKCTRVPVVWIYRINWKSVSVISDFPLCNSCKTTFFKTWSSNYTSINNNNTIINHNWRSRFHILINCFPLTGKYRHPLADDKTYLYFTDYWFLLRYTVIIYKFTQRNLGAKKIAKSRFQSPVKKKKLQIATLATDSVIPALSHIKI